MRDSNNLPRSAPSTPPSSPNSAIPQSSSTTPVWRSNPASRRLPRSPSTSSSTPGERIAVLRFWWRSYVSLRWRSRGSGEWSSARAWRVSTGAWLDRITRTWMATHSLRGGRVRRGEERTWGANNGTNEIGRRNPHCMDWCIGSRARMPRRGSRSTESRRRWSRIQPCCRVVMKSFLRVCWYPYLT